MPWIPDLEDITRRNNRLRPIADRARQQQQTRSRFEDFYESFVSNFRSEEPMRPRSIRDAQIRSGGLGSSLRRPLGQGLRSLDAATFGPQSRSLAMNAQDYAVDPLIGFASIGQDDEERGTERTSWGDFGRSLKMAATQDPRKTYQQSREAWQDKEAGLSGGERFFIEAATDPLNAAGVGISSRIAKGGLQGLRASRGGRVLASAMDDPARAILGGSAGGGAGTEIAERAGGGQKTQMAAGLAGAVVGGGLATWRSNPKKLADALTDESGSVSFDALDDVRRSSLAEYDDAFEMAAAKGPSQADRAFQAGRADRVRLKIERDNPPLRTGIFNEVKPTEMAERGIRAKYEGELNRASLEVGNEIREGNRLLRRLKIGSSDGRRLRVGRNPEMEQLYKALHGEAPVPERLREVYDDIRRVIAEETKRSVMADDDFIPRQDYFYRGWRQPNQTAGTSKKIGTKPNYMRPRKDATFTELLEEGWAPTTWNPYEMLAIRRQAGESYRASQNLFARFQEADLLLEVKQGDPVPEGWRVPEIGPAFEGKPYAFIANEDDAAFAFSSRYALPKAIAKQLEDAFGKDPDLGAFNVFVKAADATKRTKLIGSLFQQVDFTTRVIASQMGGAIDAAIRGRPIEAFKRVGAAPIEVGKIAWANVSPARRDYLRAQMLATDDLFPDKPGLNMRMIVESGLGVRDTSVVQDVVKATLEDVAREIGPASKKSKPWRVLKGLNQATQNGLFDGVYRQAQIAGIKNHIGPRIVAQHPDWSPQQIARAIADETNIRFSTMGGYQSVFQSPSTKKMIRGVIFSSNEAEGMLKMSLKPFIGEGKLQAAEYWAGAYLSLAATAEAIHYLATGEHLPADRLIPLEKSDRTGIAYRRNFLAPDAPFLKGRGNTQLSIDLVGQLDTIFRVIDPKAFIQARESVPLRAGWTQISGKDFFGRPVEGPTARFSQLVQEVLEPIGVANLRSAADIGPDTEARLGAAGSVVQASGLNMRAETNAMLKDRIAQETFKRPWAQLEQNEKQQVLTDNPEVQAELDRRLDEAVAQGSDWAEAQKAKNEFYEENAEEQQEDGRRYRLPDNHPEKLTGEQYRRRDHDRAVRARGFLDGLASVTEPFKGDRGNDPLTRFRAVLDGATKGIDTDYEAIDRFLAELPADELAYIQRNTGLYDDPVQKELRTDIKAIADSGYWDMETGKTDYLRENPRVRNLLEKWGYSTRLTDYLGEEDRYRSQQQGLDDKYEVGDPRWVEATKKNRENLRAAGAALFGQGEDEYPEGIVGEWFKVINESKDPRTGEPNWDVVNQWEDNLSESGQRELDAYEPSYLTPRVRAWKQDIRKIADSGYWDIADDYARQYAERYNLPGIRTWGQLQEHTKDVVINTMLARGFSQTRAELLADRIVDKRLSRIDSTISRQRKRLRTQRPEIGLLLARWNYYEPGRQEAAYLSRSVV